MRHADWFSTAVLGTKDVIGAGIGGLVAPENAALFCNTSEAFDDR